MPHVWDPIFLPVNNSVFGVKIFRKKKIIPIWLNLKIYCFLKKCVFFSLTNKQAGTTCPPLSRLLSGKQVQIRGATMCRENEEKCLNCTHVVDNNVIINSATYKQFFGNVI